MLTLRSPTVAEAGRGGGHQARDRERGPAITVRLELPLLQVRTPIPTQPSSRTPMAILPDKRSSLPCSLRYNHRWTRSVQNVVGTILITAWLGGLGSDSRPGEIGRLLTIEEIGELLQGK